MKVLNSSDGCGWADMLAGKRILIVEDEPLIAMDLQAAVSDEGGIVVGPATTVDDALHFARTGHFSGAIIDLRLHGVSALQVVEFLLGRSIPLVIYSGQAEITATGLSPGVPVVSKPAPPEQVLDLLGRMIARAAGGEADQRI